MQVIHFIVRAHYIIHEVFSVWEDTEGLAGGGRGLGLTVSISAEQREWVSISAKAAGWSNSSPCKYLWSSAASGFRFLIRGGQSPALVKWQLRDLSQQCLHSPLQKRLQKNLPARSTGEECRPHSPQPALWMDCLSAMAIYGFAEALLIAHSSTSGVLVQGLNRLAKGGGLFLLLCLSKMLSLSFLGHNWKF